MRANLLPQSCWASSSRSRTVRLGSGSPHKVQHVEQITRGWSLLAGYIIQLSLYMLNLVSRALLGLVLTRAWCFLFLQHRAEKHQHQQYHQQ